MTDDELRTLMPTWRGLLPEQQARADTVWDQVRAILPIIRQIEAADPNVPIAPKDWATVQPVMSDVALLIFDLVGHRRAAALKDYGVACRVFIAWHTQGKAEQIHEQLGHHT